MTTSMEIQANAAMMIQANNVGRSKIDPGRSPGRPAHAGGPGRRDPPLSTAATQLMTARASRTPQVGTPPTQDAGSPPDVSGRAVRISFPRCPPSNSTHQLLELHAERHLAEETGVARIASYMADLERDIARSHAAFVGAAVTEIASLPGAALGPELRLGDRHDARWPPSCASCSVASTWSDPRRPGLLR